MNKKKIDEIKPTLLYNFNYIPLKDYDGFYSCSPNTQCKKLQSKLVQFQISNKLDKISKDMQIPHKQHDYDIERQFMYYQQDKELQKEVYASFKLKQEKEKKFISNITTQPQPQQQIRIRQKTFKNTSKSNNQQQQ